VESEARTASSHGEPPDRRVELPAVTGASSRTTSSAVIVVGFVAVLFMGALSGEVLFWSDTHLSFEPLFGQLGDAVGTGSLLWSSLLETGKPILANPTQAPLYPPNLLFVLLPAYRAITILAALHMLLGAVGILALARRLELGRWEALACALVFAGSGATLSGIPYHGLSWCTAWLPWLLVLVDRVSCGKRRWRDGALLTLVVLMMLTIAEPFVLLAANLGVGLWLMSIALDRRDPLWKQLRSRVLPPCVAAFAAVVVALPYAAAVLNNFPESVRALGFTWDGVTIWSMHPLGLVEWVAPGVFGLLGRPDQGVFWATGLTPEKGFPIFPSLYVGGTVLALAVSGVVSSTSRRRYIAVWFAILVLLAMGRFGPLYPLLDGAPGIDAARYPIKWMVPAAVPLALLVGMGLSGLRDRSKDVSRAFLSSLALFGLALAALAGAVHHSGFGEILELLLMGDGGVFSVAHRDTVISACVRGIVPVLGSILIVVASARGRLRTGAALAVLVAVIGADLVAVNSRLVATTDADFYRVEPEALRVVRSDPAGAFRIRIDEPRAVAPRFLVERPTLETLARQQRETLSGYVPAHYGVPTALTLDTEATGPWRVLFLKVLAETAPPREQAMIYGSASITHLVTDRIVDHPVFARIGTVDTTGGADLHVYRNTVSQPRVRLASFVIPYSGDDGFRSAILGSSVDLFSKAALVEPGDLEEAPQEIRRLIPIPGQSPDGVVGRAEVLEDSGHRLTIRAENDRPAMLVISDAYLPQWTAVVDGMDAVVHRVNYCFRGVALDAGDHTVELVYRPWRRPPRGSAGFTEPSGRRR
jgi:hypothetical protein